MRAARDRCNKMDSVHPDDRELMAAQRRAAEAESAALGRPVPCCFTFRLRRKDTSYIWVETHSCITPKRCYGVRRDISDRKRLEVRAIINVAALSASISRLAAHIQTSLKTFLTSMMMDIRQPLCAIQAAADLLSQRPCVRQDTEATFLVAAICTSCTMLNCACGARRVTCLVPVLMCADCGLASSCRHRVERPLATLA